MGLLINKTDFVGRFALSQSIEDTITPYIAEYEEKYLIDLLGVELFKLFKASVVSQIPAAPYLVLYNEILEDYNRCVMRSRGMKSMLLDFIYWEYVIQTKYKHTGTGIVVDSNEVSRNADWSESFMYQKYNTAIKDYKTIQWYICQNDSVYPTFNGSLKNKAWKI